MLKRIFLFIVVNILVLLTINITLQIFGINGYLTERGIDYQALLVFCGIVGFSGAFISLAISRIMAKMMMGVKVIDPASPGSPTERSLVDTVHRLAERAGLTTMPQVGIYDSPEINAFATGPSRRRALVAVSSGLLQRMDGPAIEGVLAHELSHVANGDMVTMTLLQGVVNTFVMFFARIAAWAVAQALSGDRERDRGGVSPVIHFIAVMVFQIAFSLLGAIVVAAFSRWREYRADRGGATVAGREKMIRALQELKAEFETPVDNRHPSIAALKINGQPSRILALLASHPSLDKRIDALQRS